MIEKLPPQFQNIIDMFQEAQGKEKLEVLLEFSQELPSLPPKYQNNLAKMEQVDECQTPFFLASELEDGKVFFYYDVPPESPTIRGYASILAQGTAGASPQDILNIPPDIYTYLGLTEVMSPLRLRGMHAVLSRMKRHAEMYLTEDE
jgi:cysteine desulfuration protein SufE